MSLTSEQQQRVADAAHGWLYTPFQHGQRRKGVAVDCGNLLIAVFSEAGLIDAFAPDAYPPEWFVHSADERYLEGIARYMNRLPSDAEHEVGDVLAYRGRRWPSSGHAGIYVGDDQIIHALRNLGVRKWPISLPIMQLTFDSAWRWRA